MFHIGNVVKLRCGSPRMVVVGFAGNNFVRCAWISKDSAVHEVLVPEPALRKCWF